MQHNEKPMERRDMAAQLDEVHRMLLELMENFHSAFPKNEDGHPDFYGHREDHKTRMKQKAQMDEYRHEFTKKVVIFFATLLISLVGTGIGPWLIAKIGGN